jgi:transcriptional regulator with XRE-family HTH domain
MDWKTLIDELVAAGLSQAKIAAECGTSQSHISGLYRGARKTPGWDLGNKLISLHSERCEKVAA